MTEGLTAEAVLARHKLLYTDSEGTDICWCDMPMPCDAVQLARQLLETRTVHIVVRRGDIDGVVAVHATEDSAFEDWDARTGHGSRPDLAAKYAIEHWIVQSALAEHTETPG